MSNIKGAVSAISKTIRLSNAARKKLEKAIKKREREKKKAAREAEKLRKAQEKEKALEEKLKTPEGQKAIIKKYNDRIKKLKEKFSDEYYDQIVKQDILTDPNIKLDKDGFIDTSTQLTKDTVTYMDQNIGTVSSESKKILASDDRIQAAVEGLTDIKDIRREIAAQTVAKFASNKESFEKHMDYYYNITEPKIIELKNNRPLDPSIIPMTEYDDLNIEIGKIAEQFQAEWEDIDTEISLIDSSDTDVLDKLHAKELKTWTDIQDILHDMSDIEQRCIEIESRTKAYNKAIAKAVSSIEDEVAKRKGV